MKILEIKKSMRSFNKGIILLLVLIWSLFVAYELEMQTAIKAYPNAIIRIDLLLLPILIVLTAYIIYSLIKEKNSKYK